ncbi:T9SS type A sorting domain-containing protein [Psychroserpens jangbogonensis]|uniref:T9SS type A sorting domain-containing protein n=1 Tax=Psychroserpens jangbogonensis TaxID=1484460 RepID=UPI0013792E14|nr:T9SS type A sorting domain-containing protein [Psychroserpens jangbogonensis]
MKQNILSITCLLFAIFVQSQVQIGNDIEGEATFDMMGWDTAISGDGQTVVVGAPGSSVGAYGAGQVKVLQYNGTDWIQLGNDLLGILDEDNFGRAVDITNDGNTIIVGAQYSNANGFNSGSAQIFEFNGTDWIQKGSTLAGVNNDDEFGTTVSIANDANRIAVGAPYTNTSNFDNGVLRIYDYDGSQWNLVFEHFGDNESDVFGMSLDMSGDGNHVICGAWINVDGTTQEGYAKVFHFDASMWSQVGSTIYGETPSIFTGASSSVSDDGSIVAVGSWGNDENGTNSGEVEVFELISNNWQQLGDDIQGESGFERFGWAIDLSDSGDILAVGAPQENNTRFYRYESGSWNMFGNAISGAEVNDDFGYSVDLSSDGTKVAIGDPNNNINGSDSGFVQVYDITDVLSVEDFESQLFSVFPNPTTSKLTIQCKVEINKISIVDINGRLLNTIDVSIEGQDISIDVENLSNGIYFLKIQADNKEETIRFLKN